MGHDMMGLCIGDVGSVCTTNISTNYIFSFFPSQVAANIWGVR
jgi:hypothetical protein